VNEPLIAAALTVPVQLARAGIPARRQSPGGRRLVIRSAAGMLEYGTCLLHWTAGNGAAVNGSERVGASSRLRHRASMSEGFAGAALLRTAAALPAAVLQAG
jgi:NO-binding membrane sensor protein with MHYT domain